MDLYHVTARENLAAIAAQGLKPRTYFSSSEELRDYYCSVVEDEGSDPVMLLVDLSEFEPGHCQPDRPGIEEPITIALGKREDEIREAWEASAQTWRDSLEIVQSLRYDDWVPADRLWVCTGLEHVRLSEFLRPEALARSKIRTPSMGFA